MKFDKLIKLLESGLEDSWTDTINGKQFTVTLPEIIEYLKNTSSINIPTKKLKNLLVGAVQTPDQEHKRRIQNADLNYPIIVVVKNGKYTMLLDGNHRLQRAINNNLPTIKAKVLELSKAPKTWQYLFR